MNQPGEQPSRREILSAKSAQTNDSGAGSNNLEFGPLFTFSSNAMGCEFQVLCTDQGRQPLAAVIGQAFPLLHELESRWSIFRDTSETSWVNQQGKFHPVAIRHDLFQILAEAQAIHAETDGAFDVTVCQLSSLWKHCRHQRRLPDTVEIDEACKCVGGQGLRLDTEKKTVFFENQHLKLDLGGIGKGYALDRLRDFLTLSGCNDFIIHGGQSSVIACGHRWNLDQTAFGNWQIGISHPLKPETRLATILLDNRAVGTSGSGRQFFVKDGKRYGHIIDPRNGWPADHFLSTTVLAESAMQADALATAIFVAGPGKAQEICDRFSASAILVSRDGQTGIRLDLVNLEQDVIQLEDASETRISHLPTSSSLSNPADASTNQNPRTT